jgi:hypothetical protein
MVVHGAHKGQRAHVHYNAYWKFCNFDKAFIIIHLTMMEEPFAGMMIKIYHRLKIESDCTGLGLFPLLC